MDIFNLAKEYLTQTFALCQNFLKGIDPKSTLAAAILLFFIFLRKWELKRIITFALICSIAFIIIVRCVYLLIATFGPETASTFILAGRFVFLLVSTVVFIYYAALKE